MVHALEESWRVLTPDGYLLDTRPLSGDMRLEVIADGQATFAGLVDDSTWVTDDEAANLAVETVIHKGLFLREETANFIFFDYWDTLEQLRAYIQEKWEDTHIPETVFHSAEDLIKHSEGKTRVRTSLKMLFSRYCKLDSP